MAVVRTGYANFAAFPVTGAINIIYVDLSNGNEFTWVTSAYVAYTPTQIIVSLGYKDAAWFTANPGLLLGKGQKVHLLQTGTYKLGDGITALSALSFLGGSGSQSLAQTLAIGKIMPEGQFIQSTDASVKVSTNNGAWSVSYDDGSIIGGQQINTFSQQLFHDAAVELNTPSVTKNGVEVATVTDVNNAIIGMLDDRGNYDASVNLFPSSGGSGTAGAVLKGDLWTISVNGTLGGVSVTVGDVVRALLDTPGQTSANWTITENNLGYVPENSSNKVTSVVGNTTSNVVYASVKAIYDWAVGLFAPLASPSFTNFIEIKEASTPSTPTNAQRLYVNTSNQLRQVRENGQDSGFNMVVAKDIADGSGITGTTAITLAKSALIPANTFITGDIVSMESRSIRNTATSAYISYFYINTSSSLSGATLIGQLSSAAIFLGSTRNLYIKSTTNSETLATSANSSTSELVTSASPQSSLNIDWSVAQYIIHAVANPAVGNTTYSSGLIVTKK